MERNTKTLRHGDKVTALGLSFTIDHVLTCDFYGDAPLSPYSDFWGGDCEFIDTKGKYHHWKQNQDKGIVERWNGKRWRLI